LHQTRSAESGRGRELYRRRRRVSRYRRPSGCGKSTLLNIIAGFDRPDHETSLDGALRNGPSPKGIAISQHGSVFPWLTVQQNLMFGLTQRPRNKEALADHYAAMWA